MEDLRVGSRAGSHQSFQKNQANAEGAKLPHGYVAEKTSPGASASGPEGTEKKLIVFRSIGVM